MNSKTILISLTILVILALSVQSIRIGDSHKIRSHKVRAFATELSHKTVHYLATQEEMTSQIPPELLQELMDFAQNDEDIMKTISTGAPLTPEASDRIKDFLSGNEGLKNFLI